MVLDKFSLFSSQSHADSQKHVILTKVKRSDNNSITSHWRSLKSHTLTGSRLNCIVDSRGKCQVHSADWEEDQGRAHDGQGYKGHNGGHNWSVVKIG